MKLFVKNLPFTTTAGELHKLFEPCGKVTVELKMNKHSNRSKGFAMLNFETEEAAEKALAKHGELLGGRVMKISRHDPKRNERTDRNQRHTYPRGGAYQARGDEICFGYPVSQQIYVGGIGSLDEANVHAIFLPFGEIAQVDIMRNKFTGEPRGYGFVIFRNPMAAKASLEMDKTEIAGCNLKVSLAKMKNKYPRGGSFHDPLPESHGYAPNMWPMNSYSMGPICNPYEFNQHPYPVSADMPAPEQKEGSIVPMPGAYSSSYLPEAQQHPQQHQQRPPLTPPPSEHGHTSDQVPLAPQQPQVPFYFMNQGVQQQQQTHPSQQPQGGYLTPDLPGLISGFGGLQVSNSDNFWGTPNQPEREQRNLYNKPTSDADRV